VCYSVQRQANLLDKTLVKLYGGFDMKKTFALPLLAALLLTACSNPADGSNPAALPQAPQEQQSAPQTPQAPAAQQEEKWPQITPVNFNVDLEGYEEAPKDPVYGINWVYVAKADVDWVASQGKTSWLFPCRKDIGLKPIELHKSNPDGVRFYTDMATSSDGFSDAYKCVLYYKKNAKSNIEYTPGLGYDFKGKYFTAPGLKFKYGSSTKKITVSVSQEAVENFKKNYGQL
jgi:hypothetical protein